jgi:hypothetical protein
MALQTRSVIWLDAGSRTTQTILHANPNSSAIMAALEAHSNAGVVEWWEGPAVFPAGSNTPAVFADVSDVARLTFVTSTGNTVTVAVPAPQIAMFKPDTVTVDPSAIADIISACVGSLSTPGGVAVSSYVVGVRNQRGSGR